MSARLRGRPFSSGLKIAAALLLVAGLFLLGVALTPPAAPAHAVFDQPAGSNPSPLFLPTPVGGNKNGTLASFTALIPEVIIVNLPMVGK